MFGLDFYRKLSRYGWRTNYNFENLLWLEGEETFNRLNALEDRMQHNLMFSVIHPEAK